MKILQHRLIFPSLCLIVICISCTSRKYPKQYDSIISSEICLPDSAICISDRGVTIVSLSSLARPLLVSYIDSSECSICQASRSIRFSKWYNLADEHQNFGILILFSQSSTSLDQTIEDVRSVHMPFPLYIDNNDQFALKNKQIICDKRFHTFLLGEDGRPLLFGDPTANDELEDLYIEQLKIIKK